jgi:hypothetical protein
MLELENEGSRNKLRAPSSVAGAVHFFHILLKDSEKILRKPFAVIDNDATNYSLCALFFA